MGGYGSGRSRWRYCGTVEATRSLDVNKLNRAGCLEAGYRGAWQWTEDGDRVASIHLVAEVNRLRLIYRIRSGGEEWEDVDQPTPIDWMPCRLGGMRPFFRCPALTDGEACRRRVVKLYGAGRYFLCRHCYRLAYASQSEDEWDRAFRRANKIRQRLGAEPRSYEYLPPRPKGMHQETYERLRGAFFEAEAKGEEKLLIYEACLLRLGGAKGREF